MHMFIQNVRVPLDLSLDDANLLVSMLRAYAGLKRERADRLTDDARQSELNGERDATTMADRIVNQIDERIAYVEAKVQAFHDTGMVLPDEPKPFGWDTIEGGAGYTR